MSAQTVQIKRYGGTGVGWVEINPKTTAANVSYGSSNVNTALSSIEGNITTINGTFSSYLDKLTYLDSNDRFKLSKLPDVILGQLVYAGTVRAYDPTIDTDYEDAITEIMSGYAVAELSTNAKTLLGTNRDTVLITFQGASYSNTGSTIKDRLFGYQQVEGMFFLCSTNEPFGDTWSAYNADATGTAQGEDTDITKGDWILATAAGLRKIDNTDAVRTINGRVGNVSIYQGTFSTSTTYYVGDVVKKDSELYICTTYHTAAAWNADHFQIFGKVYSNQIEAQNGETLSLVTTGEKYTWNHKSDVSLAAATSGVNNPYNGVATTAARSDHTHDNVYLKLIGGRIYNSSSNAPLSISGYANTNTVITFYGNKENNPNSTTGDFYGSLGVDKDHNPIIIKTGNSIKRIALYEELPNITGKQNNVYYQDSEPSSGMETGDILFQYPAAS